jgi:hypothetical protein
MSTSSPWFDRDRRGTFFAATGGALALAIGVILGVAGHITYSVGFLLLGVFVWSLAGTADRWQGLVLKLFGNSLEAKLSDKPHGDEFAEAAKGAPDSALEAVIPLLREDVASDVLEIGAAFAGKRLIDPELAWLRQELHVTVFAINRPGDGEKWTGGGRISDMPLPAGTKLAVLGEPADVAAAASRMAEG